MSDELQRSELSLRTVVQSTEIQRKYYWISMHSSGYQRIDVLSRHLRSSESQPTAVQRRLCEAQPDEGKVITAEQAAASIPDNAILSVSRPRPLHPPIRDGKLAIPWTQIWAAAGVWVCRIR